MKTRKFNANKLRAEKTAMKQAISSKEMQVDNASLFMHQDIVDSLRDDLENLNKKALLDAPAIDPMLDQSESASDDNPVPESPDDIKETMVNALANSFTSVTTEKGQPKFDVIIDEGTDSLEVHPTSNLYNDEYESFDIGRYYNSILGYIDSINIGISDEEKDSLITAAKSLLDDYYYSLDSNVVKNEDGKQFLVLSNGESSNQIVEEIYNLLNYDNLAGLDAHESFENIEHADDPNMGNPQETGVGIMSNKKPFNLRKQADKVYDSVRERTIQEHDLQYRTRHPKSLPWYEDAYIKDYHWRNSVMDKYTPEKLDSEGNYRGGYINNRFKVHHNDEGNSMHIKPGERFAPDRPESYSTERRLEIMRNEGKRGYEPSEGSETEQQTHRVFASKMKVAEDHGLFRVKIGEKIVYVDTQEDLVRLAELAEAGLAVVDESKKKVTEASPIPSAPALPQDPQSITQPAGENLVAPYVQNIPQNEQAKANEAIRNAIMNLQSGGIDGKKIKEWANEYLRYYRLPEIPEDHGAVEDAGSIADMEGIEDHF
jgi:hypothetical protein